MARASGDGCSDSWPGRHAPARPALRSIELFTGAGGLALATHEAGFEHQALIERDHNACETLRENVRAGRIEGIRGWRVLEGDVRATRYARLGRLDLVAGGPPCQPFSIGGKHRGARDARDLIPEFIRAVRESAPRAFLLENVKGLTRASFRNYFALAILELTYPEITRRRNEDHEQHLRRLEGVHTRGRHGGLRYNVVYQVLNAADYGVPQTRERVFVVGFRADLGASWHFPPPTHSLDALLREQWETGDYWKRHHARRPQGPPPRFRARVERLAREQVHATAPWRTLRDAIADLPKPRADREHPDVPNHRLQPGARAYPGHTGSSLDLPSKTLKAGVHGVPGGENMAILANGDVRYLTLREAARVQTFPDAWRFRGAWSEAMRQLGNAVPKRLAQVVARSVAERLRALDAAPAALPDATR